MAQNAKLYVVHDHPLHRPIRILYVEDDEVDRHLFCEVLRQDNAQRFYIESVRSTGVADMALRQTQFDVIFVDYYIGRDQSANSASFIKQLVTMNSQVPVVLVTGAAHISLDGTLTELINSRVVQFLAKEEISYPETVELIYSLLGRNLRVLHVDDDEEDRLIVKDFLQESTVYRFTVDGAHDSASMREQMREHDYDVYLLDLHLGVDNGLALAGEIFMSEPDPTVIIISGGEDLILSNQLMRLVGKRKIGFLSKAHIATSSLLDCIVGQRNRMLGFGRSADR